MNKEELIELREKIAKLSDFENNQRNLKLKTQKIEKTGYASIDKPWLKYYSNEAILEQANHMTCYEELYHYNKNHLNETAMIYYGRKITYEELFSNIDKTAKAFIKKGVKEKDIVTICSITTPEIIYAFYALNKIGAVSNMIDLRYNNKAIDIRPQGSNREGIKNEY